MLIFPLEFFLTYLKSEFLNSKTDVKKILRQLIVGI